VKLATLSIGDELLCGEVVDTNASRIAARLYDTGARVLRHLTVADREDDIVAALTELARPFDAVVVTGGLGPTPDDLTAAAAARAAGTGLLESDEALQHLARFGTRISGGLHPANLRQALVPEGSLLIPNPLGTACGFILKIGSCRFFFLPGVPYEMQRMLEDTVLPSLAKRGTRAAGRHVLKLFGISEAAAAAKLAGCLPAGSPVELAYCVKYPEIHLILRCQAKAAPALEPAAASVRERLGEFIFAEGDETMDTALCSLFKATGLKLALAESCTGGMIAARITQTAGSSAYFLEGDVTYSNEAKTRMLQVPPQLIEVHGAVSSEVACAMATGVLRAAGSDLALAVTGIAGPDGGSAEKPVGTVFIALADRSSCRVNRYTFQGDRDGVRAITCFTALDWLRQYLLALHGASGRD
jgi:nicotinamide-nucleotide amidase